MAYSAIVRLFTISALVNLFIACGGQVGVNGASGGVSVTNATGGSSGMGSTVAGSGGKITGGRSAVGGAIDVGGIASPGSTGAGVSTSTLPSGRTCPTGACDTTCCVSDDCGTIEFAGCLSPVDCGFSCPQSLCGASVDNCGRIVGTGVANKCPAESSCACKTIADCQAAGYNCDSIPDGCGGLVSCGKCAGTDTCGGGGTPFVCGDAG
jgi:hypothetical protein